MQVRSIGIESRPCLLLRTRALRISLVLCQFDGMTYLSGLPVCTLPHSACPTFRSSTNTPFPVLLHLPRDSSICEIRMGYVLHRNTSTDQIEQHRVIDTDNATVLIGQNQLRPVLFGRRSILYVHPSTRRSHCIVDHSDVLFLILHQLFDRFLNPVRIQCTLPGLWGTEGRPFDVTFCLFAVGVHLCQTIRQRFQHLGIFLLRLDALNDFVMQLIEEVTR